MTHIEVKHALSQMNYTASFRSRCNILKSFKTSKKQCNKMNGPETECIQGRQSLIKWHKTRQKNTWRKYIPCSLCQNKFYSVNVFFFWCVCILVFEKWSHYTVQVYEELVIKMTLGLNCRDPPTFASQGLRLKVNSTILSFNQTLFQRETQSTKKTVSIYPTFFDSFL